MIHVFMSCYIKKGAENSKVSSAAGTQVSETHLRSLEGAQVVQLLLQTTQLLLLHTFMRFPPA